MSNNTQSLNIGIVGFGRMGKEIAHQIKLRAHKIAFIVDPFVDPTLIADFINFDTVSNTKNVFAPSLKELNQDICNTDIIIEFSLPDAVLENATYYAAHGISAIVGTTGWDEHKKLVENIITNANTTHKTGNKQFSYLYGGNFSIGAHILMRISKYAATLFNLIPDYDISLWETHHRQKKDRPSGTALMTAQMILDVLDRKQEIAIDLPHRKPIRQEQLAVVSQRIGHELGFHEVIADSPFDTLKISHHARTRTGFALGTLLASEWVCAGLINNPARVVGFRTVYDFIDDWMS